MTLVTLWFSNGSSEDMVKKELPLSQLQRGSVQIDYLIPVLYELASFACFLHTGQGHSARR